MRRYLAAVVLGALIAAAPAAAATPEAVWRQFRTAFPYHIQIIAIGPVQPDGSRTLIVSEPPPTVTEDDLTRALDGRAGRIVVRTHSVGYDGWLRDATTVIPRMDDAALQTLVEDLSRAIYGTAYKAH